MAEKKLVNVGMTIQTRTAPDDDFIRAYCANDEDPSERFEIASLKISLCHEHPELFREWMDFLKVAADKMVFALTGSHPVMFERKPHESN